MRQKQLSLVEDLKEAALFAATSQESIMIWLDLRIFR